MNIQFLLSAVPSPSWLWLAFVGCLPLFVFFDLRGAAPSPARARRKSAALIGVAILFAALLAVFGGPTGHADAAAFFAAWAIELALSVDNLFVFLLLFQSFNVHGPARARVLGYGIVGALVLRGLAIGAGVALVTRFAWTFYVFGAVLVFSGGKLLWEHLGAKPHGHQGGSGASEPAVVRWLRKVLPVAGRHAEASRPQAFMLVARGRIRITSLGLLLVAIEASDLIFALDSVPAGFAITSKGWLLFASNAIAILGLRAMFVALDQALASLAYLPFALAAILLFVGGKMLLHDVVEVGVATSLVVILATLLLACAASLWRAPKPAAARPKAPSSKRSA